MPTNPILLDIIEHVAASDEPLSDMARKQIATTATTLKSHQGDRILSHLARRADLDDETRKILENSSRAAVKAAWLSRTDHPPGYVEAAIAKEKRVTVLATVAAHPDAGPSLLTALAASPSTKVAVEILKRDDSPHEARVKAAQVLVGQDKDLNYPQAYLLTSVMDADRTVGTDAVAGLDSPTWWVLDNMAWAIPADQLGAYTALVLAKWEKDLDPATATRWSRTVSHRYPRALSALIGHPNWDTSSDLDRELANVAQRLKTLSIAYADSVEQCRIRHHGTDKEKQELRRKEAETSALLESARTTSDTTEILRLLSLDRQDVLDVLAGNENVTLDHLLDSEVTRSWNGVDNGVLLTALGARGYDPVELAAAWLVLTRASFSALPEDVLEPLAEEDIPEVGRLAAEYLQTRAACANERANSWSTFWLLTNRLDDERALEGAIPQMSVSDLSELLNRSYSERPKAIAGQALAKLLSTELHTDQAWETFIALAAQSEGAITEALAVARAL